jgi:DNA (cytosine-5)-methyltransferase 1
VVTRPRLLDLFCGIGGIAAGYARAGFEVTGVDISGQPDYPFELIQADALDVLATWDLSRFDVIHASPPCERDTQMRAAHRARGFDNRPDLITPVRQRLPRLGKPYVIENVPGARRMMQATLILHGGMFPGLGVHRPRLFESNVLLLAPPAPRVAEPVGVYGSRPMSGKQWTRLNGNMKGTRSAMRVARSLAEAREAMGMDWGDWDGVKKAVPPPYGEWIGGQLIEHLRAEAVPA